MRFQVREIEDLEEVCKYLTGLMSEVDTFLLEGGLGAGKTTLVAQWMKYLEISDAVSSPTFSIINEYVGESSIFHMDMYRLKHVEEALEIGIEEYLDNKKSIKIIEWPGLIMELIDSPYVVIEIENSEGIRQVNVRHHKKQ